MSNQQPGCSTAGGVGAKDSASFNPGAPPAVPLQDGEVIVMFKLRSVVAPSRQWTPAPIALAALAKAFNGRFVIVGAVVVVSLLARPTVVEASTDAAETAGDPRSYTGAGAASCTHPLFVGLKYAAGAAPVSVAIGDLDGVNGPDLKSAVLNQAGRRGWELCGVDTEGSTTYFFKRQAK